MVTISFLPKLMQKNIVKAVSVYKDSFQTTKKESKDTFQNRKIRKDKTKKKYERRRKESKRNNYLTLCRDVSSIISAETIFMFVPCINDD